MYYVSALISIFFKPSSAAPKQNDQVCYDKEM